MPGEGIGIFDSGVGGLTVLKAIATAYPHEKLHYFGDLANLPYGNKSPHLIQQLSEKIAFFLLNKNIRILVVACNTATAYALSHLEAKLSIPVIGVITPGAKEAIKRSKNKNIGIIGTLGTVKSEAYCNALKSLESSVVLWQKACPLFVPIIEEGILSGVIAEEVVKLYLEELPKNIDTLILGCTHYPLLKSTIREIVGSGVELVDSAYAVVESIGKINSENQKLPNRVGMIHFYVSDNPNRFKEFLPNIQIENREYTIQEVKLEV